MTKAMSAVALFTEDFVGGIAVRGSSDKTLSAKQEVQERTGHGAFIIEFTLPAHRLPWISEKISSTAKVLSVVGLSAVGSMLGIAYVAFNDHIAIGSTGRDSSQLLDIPPDRTSDAFNLPNVPKKEMEFIRGYLLYLCGSGTGEVYEGDTRPCFWKLLEDKYHITANNTEVINKLLSPIDKGFYDWLEESGIRQKLVGLADADVHARLWSLLAERYLIRQP